MQLSAWRAELEAVWRFGPAEKEIAKEIESRNADMAGNRKIDMWCKLERNVAVGGGLRRRLGDSPAGIGWHSGNRAAPERKLVEAAGL